jgi:uncharacterized protein YbaP (TraB family)
MKKNIVLLVSLFSVLTVFSQAPAKLANTLLWQISGKGLAKPSYVFGTMHILCADDARVSDSLAAAIGRCEEVYFEIDLSDMKGMINSLKYMRMNNDQKLSDLLDKQDYDKVKSYFEKHSPMLPFSLLEHFKPMLISSMIEEDDMDCKATNGMELVIMQEARKQQKKINGLETAEFQAGLFDSIPYAKQARELVSYLDSVPQTKKMTDTLTMAYKNQDLGMIDDLTVRGDPSVSGYLDLLLYGRNRKWVKMMKDILPAHALLFAVGAGHLPGKQGLLALLQIEGYTVTPVKN